ncbi:MAG: hypothetical protein KQH53_07280 [Desulfarculaceae bacterium]|nr:hypothetical protein [Desulfarculaceae bacterium]
MPAKAASRIPLIRRVCLPSSPWLTLEDAAQEARVSGRVLRQCLNQTSPADGMVTCGSGPNTLIHRDSLHELLARVLQPAGLEEPVMKNKGPGGDELCKSAGHT